MTANETDRLPAPIGPIIENVEPEDAPDSYVETVRTWVENHRLEELPPVQREKVRTWLEEARPQLPERSGGNRGDGEGQLGNATKVDLAKADTLEKNETIRFSDSARILGWEFSEGRVRVAIQTDVSTSVTVADALAGLEEEGAVHVPKTTQDLESGVHIVTLPVQEVQQGYGAAVTVNGATVRLSTGMMTGQNPLRYFGGTSGLLSGMILAVAMSGAAAAFVVWREDKGVIKA
ncbi:hypothetical protein [Natrinema sp. 1APR25-10V2]|uniref:hypothetical protein n=1 Tax=Natrinema sp. 1APR25-10V2 TaxID=2951081 RepID=UPI002874E1B0|nr:hypothetical protein [Natrinema sp. 1APR25-10V2]MDS0475274.1 hypothetical protein [Natrinema sp. 1APR25-10V2]